MRVENMNPDIKAQNDQYKVNKNLILANAGWGIFWNIYKPQNNKI